MSRINCERCGDAINYEDAHLWTKKYRGREKYWYVCEQCSKLTEEHLTPAYIPGYSRTRLDIRLKQAEAFKNKDKAAVIQEFVRELMEKGKTITETAKELGITIESVMLIIKDLEGDTDE